MPELTTLSYTRNYDVMRQAEVAEIVFAKQPQAGWTRDELVQLVEDAESIIAEMEGE